MCHVVTKVFEHCSICSQLADYQSGFQKIGREEQDTYLSAAADSLQVVRDLVPDCNGVRQLKQCPECATCYLYREEYEFLIGGSEDEQQLRRLTNEEAAEHLQRPARNGTDLPHGDAKREGVKSRSLVEDILAASGKPIAGHTLGVKEMQRAVDEGRVLEIYFWSSMADSEASFGFATSFGLDSEGRVSPRYLVFPMPIPAALRRSSSTEWEEVEEVYAAFGINV